MTTLSEYLAEKRTAWFAKKKSWHAVTGRQKTWTGLYCKPKAFPVFDGAE